MPSKKIVLLGGEARRDGARREVGALGDARDRRALVAVLEDELDAARTISRRVRWLLRSRRLSSVGLDGHDAQDSGDCRR